jgi:hypothetical protein
MIMSGKKHHENFKGMLGKHMLEKDFSVHRVKMQYD